ncbi:MAG TPA: hypothetical protein VHZ49_04295 [Methylomirabilota bacterium]|jgi:hypothetical protein|nr:hypothetical protein [Methylomirabilota bacterium]
MTTRLVIVGALAAGALCGCSSAPAAGVYVKPGVSAEQLARDRSDCAARAAATDTRNSTLAAAGREDVAACMRARGYVLRKE